MKGFISQLVSGTAALFALGMGAPAACAVTTLLNDTGQITCFNNEGSTGMVSLATPNPVDSGLETQDCTRGASAADVLGLMPKIGDSIVPGRDYTKISNDGDELPLDAVHGNGPSDWACTRDNITGLTWEVKTNDTGLRDQHHAYTWHQPGYSDGGGFVGGNSCNGTLPSGECNTNALVAAVNALALCGQSDWRLPTGHELISLVHYQSFADSWIIDSTWFPNTTGVKYWTGISRAWEYAWYVSFADGTLGSTSKFGTASVRLVRGGETTPPITPRYSLYEPDPIGYPESTVVVDNHTGLMWKHCPEGRSGYSCGTGSLLMKVDWSTALNLAGTATHAGFSDWRLPNAIELHSVIDHSGDIPRIATQFFPFPGTASLGFWSSTTHGIGAAVEVSLYFGNIGHSEKTNARLVRLVRGGQFLGPFDSGAPPPSIFRDGFESGFCGTGDNGTPLPC